MLDFEVKNGEITPKEKIATMVAVPLRNHPKGAMADIYCYRGDVRLYVFPENDTTTVSISGDIVSVTGVPVRKMSFDSQLSDLIIDISTSISAIDVENDVLWDRTRDTAIITIIDCDNYIRSVIPVVDIDVVKDESFTTVKGYTKVSFGVPDHQAE